MRIRAWSIALVLLVARVAVADRADDAYAEGRRHYDLQEWDQAIEKFKESYRLRSDAASLFNIAQAYRLKGDCADAVRTYKTYKRNYPTAKNIAVVDKWIDELEPCPAAAPDPSKPPTVTEAKPGETKPGETKPGETKPGETKPVETKPVDSKPGETKPGEQDPSEPIAVVREPRGRRWTWVAAGSAVLFTASGTYFGLKARSEFNEYKRTTDQMRFRELRDLIPRHARNANLSFILGGASAIAAGVLFVVEGRRSRTSIAFDPVTNSVVASGRF